MRRIVTFVTSRDALPDEFWALVRPIYGEPAFIFDGAENIRVTIEPLGDENPQPLQVQQP